MKGKSAKTLTLFLAFAMLLGLASACGKEAAKSTDPTTMVVGYNYFNQQFSPFFNTSAYDQEATAMTQVGLLASDRSGDIVLKSIKGEKRSFNGTDYTYTGISDIEIVENSNGTVDYHITIRDDIKFSDGEKLTIDDAIFSFYVYSDATYDGSSTFYSVPVTGMQSYRTGIADDLLAKYSPLADDINAAGPDNDDFSGWTQAQQDWYWKSANELGLRFTQEIINYCEIDAADYKEDFYNDLVALAMYWWYFGDYNDDGIFVTAVTETEYDLANGVYPTLEDYWNEIYIAYDGDLASITDVESAGMDLLGEALNAFIAEEGKKDPSYSGEVMSIAGIKRTGDYSMTVSTDFFEATTIYQLGIEVAPLHYYGDKGQYDYNNSKFGFPKGDLTIVRDKTTVPLGAGPYKFVSYANGVITYEANENFYRGKPKTQFILFQEGSDADMLSGVISGSLDICEPSFGVDAIKTIKENNTNNSLSGNKLHTSTVDNLGYAYLGISAKYVNVGGVPDSDASKNLRKGLCTVFAAHRETVIKSYYEDAASIIQYPISNTSWAAPRPNDEGYKIAYSTDVNGNQIYTDSMTEQQKFDAALEACVGFLKAAGYTWDDASGKFTAAPDGAKMAYECGIGGDGIGDHPSYGILTSSKEALATIGITIEVYDPAQWSDLLNKLDTGSVELWFASWSVTLDPDMYQTHHSSNIYGLPGSTNSNTYAIADSELDRLIMEARSSADQTFRKATYKRCLEIIMDWGVEMPNFQRQNAIVFSSERIKINTITPDITTFWGWMNDIELIEAID